MYIKCILKLFFLFLTSLIQYSATTTTAVTHEKIGIVLLHGFAGGEAMCREWGTWVESDFKRNNIHASSSQFAIYIPEADHIAEDNARSWFPIKPLFHDLSQLSEPAKQTPENITLILNKIKSVSSQLTALNDKIQAFREREEIEIRNLHLVGYSQGGIFAQMLAYSLPSPCGSLFIAGCPWMPEENIQKPLSVIMAINKDDHIFGRVYEWSRDLFKQKVGDAWFGTTVKEVIQEIGGHGVSHAAVIEGINHFKALLGSPSEESVIIGDTIN